jgi:hypothetical protein
LNHARTADNRDFLLLGPEFSNQVRTKTETVLWFFLQMSCNTLRILHTKFVFNLNLQQKYIAFISKQAYTAGLCTPEQLGDSPELTGMQPTDPDFDTGLNPTAKS